MSAEVHGGGALSHPSSMSPVVCRAGKLFAYMKNYNYEVKDTGEVITFVGNYRSSRGQAAAITFYMFVGMLCCGLVFSIAAPGGNLWYLLTLLTPLAPWYYYQNADRCAALAVKVSPYRTSAHNPVMQEPIRVMRWLSTQMPLTHTYNSNHIQTHTHYH